MEKAFINSSIKKIGELLSGTIKYSVPLFQRGFSWEREQIEQMWEDIKETISENRKEYFLGSIVLNQKKENEIEIVDGQQRLAVITIIFAVIRDIYHEMNDERYQDMQFEYIAKKDMETRQIYGKLTLNKGDNDFFKKYIQEYERFDKEFDKEKEYKKEKSLISSNKLIFAAYSFYRQKIKEELDKSTQHQEKINHLLKLTKSIAENFKIIATYVGNESDAYIIFETLNDRGLDLSVTDLLKNYLFSKAVKDINNVQKKWDEMTTILSNKNINTFLRHFWISSKHLVREKNLYSVLKKDIKAKGEVLDFVSHLKNEAEIYEALLNPEVRYWKDPNISNLLKDMNTLNVKQCLPFLLSCNIKFNDSDFKKILNICINFTFRYSTICNYNPNELERLYSSIAIKIRSSDTFSIPDIKKEIKNLCPNDTTFKNAFSEKELKEKKIARYILEKINDSEMKTEELKVAGSGDVNLEHILPQNPSVEWEEYLEQKKLDYKELVNRIGNMTLLGSDFNKKASNKFFDKKRDEIYKKSVIPITESLCSIKEWNDKTIETRQKEFATIAIEIWKISD